MSEDKRSIDTGGGAHVGGDVRVEGGGDFVGRDKRVEGDEVHGDKIVVSGLGTKIPHQAPDLQLQYVERRAELNRLKALLLPVESDAHPPISRAVLHGIAAVGKSTLAAAWAHDEAVQKVFPDGVLWTTLGTKPDLPLCLEQWGHGLDDPLLYVRAYDKAESASSRLQKLLYDKACLLVVDDAWEPEHVEPFLVGGSRCLLLVTSRRTDVLTGATEIPLDEMREAEALQLMANWAGEIDDADQATAAWLAEEVTYLPLALELLAAQAKGPEGSWSKARVRWEARKLAAVKRGRKPTKKEDSLQISLELSLGGLDEDDQESYLQLGIFPEDSPFPVSAAAALWDWDAFDAEEFLVDLVGQALLTPRVVDGEQRYTFHDIQRDFVIDCLGEARRVEAHGALVDGYRARCGGQWAELEPDGYLHDHLAWHMAEAGLREELYTLIDKPWRDAQFERTYSHRAFARDVDLAIEAASAEEPINWVQLVRGSLVYATLRSVTSRIPPEVLGMLARMGRSARALGFAALMENPDRRSQAYVSIAKALTVRGERRQAVAVLRRALTATESISGSKDSNLKEVAICFARVGEAAQALDLVRRISNSTEQAKALIGMASAAGEAKDVDGLAEMAKAIESSSWRDWPNVICGMAQGYAEMGLKSQAAAMADKALSLANARWYDPQTLWNVTMAFLSSDQREKAAAVAREGLSKAKTQAKPLDPPEDYFGRDLWYLARAFGWTGDRDGLDIVLELIQSFKDERNKAPAQSAVAGALARMGEYAPAKVVVDQIEDARWKANAWATVASFLDQAGHKGQARKHREQALAAIEAMEDGQTRTTLLISFAIALAKMGEIDWAEAVVEIIGPRWAKAHARYGLAGALVEAGQRDRALEVIEQLLQSLEGIPKEEYYKTSALEEVAQRLADTEGIEDELNKLVSAAQRAENGRLQAVVLQLIVEKLVEAGRQESVPRLVARALEAIDGMEKVTDKERASWLIWGGQVLARSGQQDRAQELAESALAAAKRVTDAASKATALVGVAEILAEAGETERAKAVAEAALAAAREIEKERQRSQILEKVAGLLARTGAVGRALAALQAIEDREYRFKVQAIGAVAQALAKAQNTEGLGRMLTFAGAIPGSTKVVQSESTGWAPRECPDERERKNAVVRVVEAMAKVGDRQGLGQSLTLVEGFTDEEAKQETLVAIVQGMADLGDRQGLSQSLNLVERFADEKAKQKTLVAIAQAMAELGDREGVDRSVALAEAIGPEDQRAWAFDGIARAMAALEDVEGLHRLLEAAQGIAGDGDRPKALWGIATAYAEIGETGESLRVLRMLEGAKRDPALAQMVRPFVRRGSEADLMELFKEVEGVASEYPGSKAVGSMAVALVKMGKIEQALSLRVSRANDLVELAQALLAAARHAEARELLDRAMTSALAQGPGRYPSASQRAHELIRLARVLVEAGLRGQRAEPIRQILSLAQIRCTGFSTPGLTLISVQVLGPTGITPAVTELGLEDRALQVARQAMTEALAAAHEFERESHGASELIEVAMVLTEANVCDAQWLARVLAMVQTIENTQDRALALVYVAEILAEMDQDREARRAMADAFDTARLSDRECVFKVLREAVPELAAVDQCQTLWQLAGALEEVEGWWAEPMLSGMWSR